MTGGLKSRVSRWMQWLGHHANRTPLGKFRGLKRLYYATQSRIRSRDVLGHQMFIGRTDVLGLARFGVYEPEQTALVARLLRPGSIVVDVGAHIGYYTLQFLRGVGREGLVFAFEPDPENFAVLARNVALNGYSATARLHNAALSDRPGQLRLYRSDVNQGDHRIFASSTEAAREGVGVRADILDNLLTPEQASRWSLLKMDVQGAEGIVLRGMVQSIARAPQLDVLCEFTPASLRIAGTDPAGFLRQWRALGFSVYEQHPSGARAVEQDETLMWRLENSDPDYVNLLITRRSSAEVADITRS